MSGLLTAAAWREINGEVVETIVLAHAKRNFSGDINIARDGWQITWSVEPYFSPEPFVGMETVKASMDRYRPGFSIWVEQDGGILHIALNCGKITGVRIRNSRNNHQTA